jgi:hypothetical protein
MSVEWVAEWRGIHTYPLQAPACPAVASKTAFPSRSFTAIKLSVYRNAKPQLGIGNLPAKLGLGVPSRADFTLNVS